MLNIQATGNLYGETITVKQISKAAAAKLFAAGKEVYLQSSNMRPFNMWQNICPVKLDGERLAADIKHNEFCINLYTNGLNDAKNMPDYCRESMLAEYTAKIEAEKSKIITPIAQFSQIVNEYKWYNCDGERGKYVHFYQKIK